MSTILDKIIKKKQQEILTLTQQFPVDKNTFSKRSLIQVLKNAENISVITEFKRASPSKGVINSELDPVVQAQLYEQYGATAISVLTDQSFFKGSFQDLRNIREAVNVPVLCKDFMVDSLQIDVAKAYGADIILLIVAALDELRLKSLYEYAVEQGLEVLVEVHDEEELERALKVGAELIGINNRNLKTFEVNLDVTKKLGPIVKQSGGFLVSESGIRTALDVQDVIDAGAQAILVGETLMRSGNVSTTMSELLLPLRKGSDTK